MAILGADSFERFCGLKAEWAEPEQARVVCIGSVLDHLSHGWDGVIVGAGKLHESSRLYLSRKVKILLLRGPLTARGLPDGGDCSVHCIYTGRRYRSMPTEWGKAVTAVTFALF